MIEFVGLGEDVAAGSVLVALDNLSAIHGSIHGAVLGIAQALAADGDYVWESLQGRFVLAFLFEYAATLGRQSRAASRSRLDRRGSGTSGSAFTPVARIRKEGTTAAPRDEEIGSAEIT